MVLNGDSGSLPLPDRSVDAVVTDPPYFDFVHYSELSDFFYAWLSPVLADRFPWMRRPDCSDKDEVQQKDPRAFARQLSRVFSEAGRVLKDDGVLAFSFHHSRAEGWAAIYEAIETGGLAVVAAHPVHAELRSASPKNAAKDPISLDAILVCRKLRPGMRHVTTAPSLMERTEQQARPLEAAGMTLSSADRFVIAASQLLVDAGPEVLSYEEIRGRLEAVRQDISIATALVKSASSLLASESSQTVAETLA